MSDNSKNEDSKESNETGIADSSVPIDPSNTSSIGDKVDQGVISIKEGISEQINEWEEKPSPLVSKQKDDGEVENYLKNPSPEDNTIADGSV